MMLSLDQTKKVVTNVCLFVRLLFEPVNEKCVYYEHERMG